MPTAWITYAWADNRSSDVDFIAQELTSVGLEVKLDRWNIESGKRLWEQIANFIQNPSECDAWIIYATPNSLGSQACKEEFAYALDRALNSRSEIFPVIGLFPGSIDNALIPAAIRTRLYVSLTDPNWKERIKAAVEGRAPNIIRQFVDPYFIKVHPALADSTRKYAIELRPRAGAWSPFVAAIPINEREVVNPDILHGPAGGPPAGGVLYLPERGKSRDDKWWILSASNEATPTQSYYLLCDSLPSKIGFGLVDKPPQYLYEFGSNLP